jgi:hypothetical protein
VKFVFYTCTQHCSNLVLVLVSISWYTSFTKKQRGICWHTKMVRLCEVNIRIANLVLTLDNLQFCLGYTFYRTRGSSLIFWMWFCGKGVRNTWRNTNIRLSHEFKLPRWNLCKDDEDGHLHHIIIVKSGWSPIDPISYWRCDRFSDAYRSDLSPPPVVLVKPKWSKCKLYFTIV